MLQNATEQLQEQNDIGIAAGQELLHMTRSVAATGIYLIPSNVAIVSRG